MITECINDYYKCEFEHFKIFEFIFENLYDQYDGIIASLILMSFEKLLKNNFKEAQISRTSI